MSPSLHSLDFERKLDLIRFSLRLVKGFNYKLARLNEEKSECNLILIIFFHPELESTIRPQFGTTRTSESNCRI